MPRAAQAPKYGNAEITALIKEYIHDKADRKMLYLHLVDGETIENIADYMNLNKKTVWKHLMDGKKELFSHIPYEPDGD